MIRTPIFASLSRVTSLSLFALLAGCVSVSTPDSNETAPSTSGMNRTGTAPAEPMTPPLPAPAVAVEIVEAAPAVSGDHVIFFAEPNYRGESFIVETGGFVEDLRRLPRSGGSWSNSISSFRIVGVATVVAYAEADFRGPRLEISSSLGDLVAERRGGASAINWDNAISSLRVVPPRSRTFEPAPGYDRRTAENIVQRAYRDILGRDADADGLRSYREKLMEQAWSEEDVRNHIRRSGEFHAINPDEVITKAFREILKRDPDPEGLRHYRDLLVNRGWTIPQLRAELLRSDEWNDKHVREVITKAYRDILGRDPDPDGLANYQKAVREKAWGEQQIRDALERSAEARQRRGK
jgi:Domain of unknown function (DUF4214)